MVKYTPQLFNIRSGFNYVSYSVYGYMLCMQGAKGSIPFTSTIGS